ncbi:cytochrome c biogenesis protein CcsA [bacterium]|nr:cytochrome c biogenesis protein CcsA [bacterium]
MKRILGLTTIVGFIVMFLMVFLWSPIESSMGLVQKIMYVHVPSAWTGYLAVAVAFIFSILYLWKRIEQFDVVASCSIEIGAIFCGLALITGSIWAKPTWNTFWTWDARLTTTLILFLIIMGYLLLRRFSEYGEKQARISAVIAIIGFLDIILVHMSVVWWRTLHQPSTVFSEKPEVINDQILTTLIICVSVFSILYAFLLISRIELEQKNRLFFKKISAEGELN